MNDESELETLTKLRDRLVSERLQLLHQLARVSANSPLPVEVLQSLAVFHTATLGVDAAIAAHSPRLGHGAEE